MATTKRHLSEIGGWEAMANYHSDDFELGNRIARHNYRVELMRKPVWMCVSHKRRSDSIFDTNSAGRIGIEANVASPLPIDGWCANPWPDPGRLVATCVRRPTAGWGWDCAQRISSHSYCVASWCWLGRQLRGGYWEIPVALEETVCLFPLRDAISFHRLGGWDSFTETNTCDGVGLAYRGEKRPNFSPWQVLGLNEREHPPGLSAKHHQF